MKAAGKAGRAQQLIVDHEDIDESIAGDRKQRLPGGIISELGWRITVAATVKLT